tara:strand:+ start:2105 stop:2281 length:177 start_codon:yes stop_codon:yes gene_type:complete
MEPITCWRFNDVREVVEKGGHGKNETKDLLVVHKSAIKRKIEIPHEIMNFSTFDTRDQ